LRAVPAEWLHLTEGAGEGLASTWWKQAARGFPHRIDARDVSASYRVTERPDPNAKNFMALIHQLTRTLNRLLGRREHAYVIARPDPVLYVPIGQRLRTANLHSTATPGMLTRLELDGAAGLCIGAEIT
jgi:hypothetical protein